MLAVVERSALTLDPEGFKWHVFPSTFTTFLCSYSHTVCSVVCLGPTQHAVPSLCFLLDLLEEVWGTEDPDPA